MRRCGCLAIAVTALGALVAAADVRVSPTLLDLGEIPAGASSTQMVEMMNTAEEVAILERVEAGAGVTLQVLRDLLDPREMLPICICQTVSSRLGAFTNEVDFVIGSETSAVCRVRIVGTVVPAEAGVEFPDAGFAVAEAETTAGGRTIVWRCSARAQACLDASRKPTLPEVFDALTKLKYIGDRLRSYRAVIVKRILTYYFIDNQGTDEERLKLIVAENGSLINMPDVNNSFYSAAKNYWFDHVRKPQIQAAAERAMAEQEAQRAEKKRRREEQERREREESTRRFVESVWHRASLPGNVHSKVWQEYLDGEGKAFADNVYFKTNVFLPFCIREFQIDREMVYREQILSFLEKDFADLLCHTGESWTMVMTGRIHPLAVAPPFSKAPNWAYEVWKNHQCKNPFVLALLPYAHQYNECRVYMKEWKEGRRWAKAFELSASDVPQGREALAAHFVREAGQYPPCRAYQSKDTPGERARRLVAWCRALEQEGAKPEHWRCVLLLALRVGGVDDNPRPNLLMADELEKAQVAPIMVRMLREEPAYGEPIYGE